MKNTYFGVRSECVQAEEGEPGRPGEAAGEADAAFERRDHPATHVLVQGRAQVHQEHARCGVCNKHGRILKEFLDNRLE